MDISRAASLAHDLLERARSRDVEILLEEIGEYLESPEGLFFAYVATLTRPA